MRNDGLKHYPPEIEAFLASVLNLILANLRDANVATLTITDTHGTVEVMTPEQFIVWMDMLGRRLKREEH